MGKPLDDAIAHHRSGRFDEAERGYRCMLDADPGNPDVLHLLGVTLSQRGRAVEALGLIDSAITLKPDVAAYHGNRGEVLRALGRHDDAASALTRALELDPTLATAHNNLGLIQRHMGAPEPALASFDHAVRFRPGFAIAHVNRGDVLQQLGRLDEAAAAYRRALDVEPDQAWVHTYLGHVLVELGDPDRLDEAEQHCLRAVALAPQLGQAHNNLGNVWVAMGRWEEALGAYHRALAVDPSLALPWNNLGRAQQQLGRFDDALRAYEEALAREPRSAQFHANLASLLAERDRDEDAIERYRLALLCDSNHAESHHGLALVLWGRGERAEARTALDEAIRLKPRWATPRLAQARFTAEDGAFEPSSAEARAVLTLVPHSAEAYFLLAMNDRGRLPDVDLDAMRALLDRRYLGDDALATAGFGIATVLDARGQHAEAAGFLALANARQAAARQRRGEQIEPGRITHFVDGLMNSFTPDFFRAVQGRGSTSRRPIFVVGVPRSGTTLVEQILASHPGVFGAGELDDVSRIAHDLAGVPEEPAEIARRLLALDSSARDSLANRYLARLETLESSSQHVVDKMPGNYLHLGLIAALWPEARVILCRRDPRDVAVSCWSTSFGAIRWANDFGLIAEQIVQHDRLVAHWKATLPTPPIEIVYETLVADFENEARRLIAALGLAWDPACLDFHTLARPVRTASLKQVRQPIYSRSIGRWKHYRAAMAPFYEAFAQSGRPLDEGEPPTNTPADGRPITAC